MGDYTPNYGTIMQGATDGSGSTGFRDDPLLIKPTEIAKFAQECGNFSWVLGQTLKLERDFLGRQITKHGGSNGGNYLSGMYNAAAINLLSAIENGYKAIIDDLLKAIIAAAQMYARAEQDSAGGFGHLLDGNAFQELTNLAQGPDYYHAPPPAPPLDDQTIASEAGGEQQALWTQGGGYRLPAMDIPMQSYGPYPTTPGSIHLDTTDTYLDRTADLNFMASHVPSSEQADVQAAADATKNNSGNIDPQELDNPWYWGDFGWRGTWVGFKRNSDGGDRQAQELADFWDSVLSNINQGQQRLLTSIGNLQYDQAWQSPGGEAVGTALHKYVDSIRDLVTNMRAVAGSLEYTAGWLGRFNSAMPTTHLKDPNGYPNNPAGMTGPYEHYNVRSIDPDTTAVFAPEFENIFNAGVQQSLASIPSDFHPAGAVAPQAINPSAPLPNGGGSGSPGEVSPGGAGGLGGPTVPQAPTVPSIPTGPTAPQNQDALQQALQAGQQGLQSLQQLGQQGSQAAQQAAQQGAQTAQQAAEQGSQAAQQLAQAMQGGPQALQQALDAAKQSGGLPINAAKAVKDAGTALGGIASGGMAGGGGGAGGGNSAALANEAEETGASKLFPRAALAESEEEARAAAATEAEESGAGRAGMAPMAGAPGAAGSGAAAGQQKERKRADYLDSKRHLEDAFDEPLAVKAVVEPEQ